MRLIFNKIKTVLLAFAVVAAMLCGVFSVSAAEIKGFKKPEVYSFCSDKAENYSAPNGTGIETGNLSWQLYDSHDSKRDEKGLYIGEGYLRLAGNNPVNQLSDFKIEIAYSSSPVEGSTDDVRTFLIATSKDYTTAAPLITNSGTLIGISDNGDVYFKGKKINHADGGSENDILTVKNSHINSDAECRLTIIYVDGKLTVTVTYNQSTVKLVENHECAISGLRQFVLGADKTKRLKNVTYKSVSFYAYGEYEPYKETDVKAVVQYGEAIDEFNDAAKAMNAALNHSGSVFKLYSDMTMTAPVTVGSGKTLTVDLNGHTMNRNCHSKMVSNGYAFLINGGTLIIDDSAPNVNNFSNSVRGGVITGGAGDDVGGCIQMNENSKLIMTGGSIVSCITNDHGGAIRVNGSGVKIDISDADFYSNMTVDSADNSHGGAIYSDYSDCEVLIKDSVFDGNYSEDCGGAVYVNDGKFTAMNCLFNSNKCLDDGGAVYVEKDATASFDRCVFTNNRSDGQGGAAYCNSGDGTRFSGVFRNNSAGGAGGALFVNGDKVSVQDAVITNNTTGDRGGAMYVDEMYDINIQGNLVVKNNYKSDGSRDDIFLDSVAVASAEIYDGGLYEDSEVWVLTSGSSQTVCGNISAYQQRYFHCDDSSKTMKFTPDSSKTQKQSLITSAIGDGNIKFIIIAAAAVLITAAAIVIVKSKKKGAKKNEKDA